MKRTFFVLAMLLTAALLLTACGGAEPYECTDALGCVSYAPDEPVRIASALVISGPNTDLG
ncbi:MAG: ABC transporter substrate-binding protein, partial [Anaerolineales bacterium]